MICYLDASALVKRYVSEPGSEDVKKLFAEAVAIGTALISRAEVGAAFAKASRLGALTREQAEAADRVFSGEWPSFMRLQMTEPMIERAVRLAWKHGLHGYDSVQLAAALLWQEAIAVPLTMATFDRHLWEVAQEEGLVPCPKRLP